MIDALPLLLGPEGYQISRSVRLRSSASAYFNRTPASVTNRQTWTWSGWVKRGRLGATQGLFARNDGSVATYLLFTSSDTLGATSASGAVEFDLATTQVFRDPSAWYHIILVLDTTQATSSNRVKLYVNGSLITALSTASYPTQNYNAYVNTAATHYIGNGNPAGSLGWYSDQYLTEINFIDGQALTPSSFGETNPVTGVWQPKKYTGTYGTNGFFLNFSDNSAATAAAIGKDYSGNGNNWTPNNISVTAGVTYDSMLDVPTQWADGGNGRGNYATWNPLDKNANGSIAGGNLNNTNGSANNAGVRSTFALPQSGKWYAELVVNASTSGTSALGFGFATATADMGGSVDSANKYDIYGSSTGSIFSNTTSLTGSLGAFTASDILQIAYDGATGKAWVGKNNTWYNSSGGSTGDPANGTNQTFTLSGEFFLYSYYYNTNASLNCGQRPFSYTPPSGFKALNTQNLPTPTILKGNQYFDATLWDGNSTNARVITTNVSTVDFAWVKKRNGADDHRLANTVTGGNKHLKSNTTEAESTATTIIQAFSGSTFTLGTDNSVNATGGTYVGWTWAEGATQGFDIVTYTGTGATLNVSHNLGVVPKMIITKSRSAVGGWPVYHASIGATGAVQLESTGATNTSPAYWNNTAPTSTQFTLASGLSVNGTTYVAYLFAEVAGFSRFGSYTGNGSADGPFVFCGFRPRFVMWKNASAAEAWLIEDTARSTYNELALELYPSTSGAETAGSSRSPTQQFDFLSNGFKVRGANNQTNGSGNTIIFAAFAESPFKNSLAR